MRIGHAFWNCGVAGAHRTHIAGSEAGHASAARNPEVRWTISGGDGGRGAFSLRLRGGEFARRVPCHTDCHPRHVIGDEKWVLALRGLHGAIAGCFGLLGGHVNIEASAICGGGSGEVLQFLLDGIR